MKVSRFLIVCMALLATSSSVVTANPYPDPQKVPQEPAGPRSVAVAPAEAADVSALALESIRITVAWDESDKSYQWKNVFLEQSGTKALKAKAKTLDWRGSFRGVLTTESGEKYYSSIGTGYIFRALVRDLSFRFPEVSGVATFEMYAENSESGEMQLALSHEFDASEVPAYASQSGQVETRALQKAETPDSLVVAVYAEGYKASEREQFFRDAAKVPGIFARYDFPMRGSLQFVAVFAHSNKPLGKAVNKGQPIVLHDSFLGLYYPYWRNFGRWYHVVYPTSEEKYRGALASAPYDYPVALIKSSEYWGVGNYNELTAVPSNNRSFGYLLMHELGHYLGLNEEYEGGGRTELEFAPAIKEPWSQNITFETDRSKLKWAEFVAESTPVPTSRWDWIGPKDGPWGVYKGGYADSDNKRSHKPGFKCVMSSGKSFCPICRQAIEQKIKYDLGQSEDSQSANIIRFK